MTRDYNMWVEIHTGNSIGTRRRSVTGVVFGPYIQDHCDG